MQRLKLLGLALITVFVLGAAASSVASAETAGIKLLPNVGEAAGAKFTVKGVGTDKPKLETVGGQKIVCEKFSGTGEALTDPLGDITIKFEECKDEGTGLKCTGLSDATTGNITVEGAEYHFRYLLPSPNSGVQLLVLIKHVHFSCTALALVLVLGCVASMNLTKDDNTVLNDELVKLFLVSFLQTAGAQSITSVDNEAATGMETCELLAMLNAGAYEKAGELANAVVEKFEKPAGTAIEILLMH